MRTLVASTLFLALLSPGFSQTALNGGAGLPKNPREILAAAAPFYDFSSPELKPWHLKAHYQLYDLKGNPTDQGVWEYWWVSPKVHRSSWSRTGAEHTEWWTAEGALYRKDTGSPLRYFERTIREDFLSQLPRRADLESGRIGLDLRMLPPNKPQLACVITQWLVAGKLQTSSSGTESYYCFDLSIPALRETYSNQLTREFSQLVKIQGRYLARQVVVTAGKQRLFTASVDTVEALNPTEAMFSPTADATLKLKAPNPYEDSQVVTTGSQVKKIQPVYPSASKRAREQGVVTLAAVIGTDGKIHDLEVLASPSAKLAESAVDAVKKWEYKPYLLNGELVEVDTIVSVTFSLSN
jgi:TonB family protein